MQNAGQLLKTVDIGDPYAKHSFKIVVSPTEISVWDNGNLVIDGYKLPEESKSYGFGPITSHISHSCAQLSYYTFSNIRMETNETLTLAQALNEYEWKKSGLRALAHVSDNEIDELSEEGAIGKTAEAINKKAITYVGVGNDENEEQFANLLKNPIKGALIDGNDVSAFTDDLTELLWSQIQADMEDIWSYPACIYLSTVGMTPFIDTEPPVISLETEKLVWQVGELIKFEASATDNDEVAEFEVYVNGDLIATTYGRQFITANSPGLITIEIVARDFAGNEARESLVITVGDIDLISPEIILHQPLQGVTMYDKTDIIASITDNAGIASWKLDYKFSDDDEYMLISQGTEAVQYGIIGAINPEEMKEGIYDYIITAIDTSDNTSWRFRLRLRVVALRREAVRKLHPGTLLESADNTGAFWYTEICLGRRKGS